jgi:hypothetical protein
MPHTKIVNSKIGELITLIRMLAEHLLSTFLNMIYTFRVQ